MGFSLRWQKCSRISFMVIKLVNVLKNPTELYILKAQSLWYGMHTSIKLLFPEMLDFCFYCESYFPFIIHHSSQELEVCFERASNSCLIWRWRCQWRWRLLWRRDQRMQFKSWFSLPSSLTLGKPPCFSELQILILRIQMPLALCIS